MYLYFAQVIAGIGLSWAIYRVVLRKKASAKNNRFFLLGGLILPFILPLIQLSPEVVSMAEPILLPAIEVGGQNATSSVQPSDDISNKIINTLNIQLAEKRIYFFASVCDSAFAWLLTPKILLDSLAATTT